MKRLVINKFNWWISNDPSIWWTGSLFNAEWIDVHTDSKEVKLAKSFNNNGLINTRTLWQIVSSLYESTINYVELSKDWYLSWLLQNDTNIWFITKELGTSYNLWKITNIVDTYWFIISDTKLYQWVYNSSKGNLWTYSTATGINTDPWFDLWTGWTIWANWSIAGSKATHTAWSTAVLSRSMPDTVAQDYRIAVSATVTAWTCAVKVAWTTLLTLSSSTNSTVPVTVYTAAADPELLEFVPSSDFVWDIFFCNIQEYNITSYTKSFNESAPYVIINNFIYVGNGSVITEIDTTWATWVITDVLTIDLGYTIKGITKIWDQVFIYATDWTWTRQYLWDWVNTTTSRTITWVDKPVLNVANFANIDYILTWWSNRQTLSVVNWYRLDPIYQTPEWIDSDSRMFFKSDYTNAIETIWNKLLIPWVDWVYSYGKRTPWLPNALVKEFLVQAWAVTSMFFSEDIAYSLFTYVYGSINWTTWTYRQLYNLAEWGNEQYWVLNDQHTGWVEIQSIFWQTYSNVKNFEKIETWISLEADTQVNVYKKVDENYANIYITWSGYTFAEWDTYTKSWVTYTIVTVTEQDSKSGYILHCTYDWDLQTLKTSWTFTRTAWSGPATAYSNLVRFWYKLLQQITDATDTTINEGFDFNKTSFVAELISFNSDYTPRLFDINLYYNDNDDN